jgi:hypothetical protein
MRRLPEEDNEVDLVGWFAACLVLAVIVSIAFIFFGEISPPAKHQRADLCVPALSYDGPACASEPVDVRLPERIDADLLMAQR